MMEPMASQVVLLSAFKLNHILGFNTMHHDDFWEGSASPENADRWAVSQGSAMSPPDTATILLLWDGWIPAWLGKVAREKPSKTATCTKTFFQVSWNGRSVLTLTRARGAEFSLPVQYFWANWLGGTTCPGSPPRRGQVPPVTLHPLQASALVQDKHLGNQS